MKQLNSNATRILFDGKMHVVCGIGQGKQTVIA